MQKFVMGLTKINNLVQAAEGSETLPYESVFVCLVQSPSPP